MWVMSLEAQFSVVFMFDNFINYKDPFGKVIKGVQFHTNFEININFKQF